MRWLPLIGSVYIYVMKKKKECLLGPFQGKVACTRIPYGKGVVGTCAKEQKRFVVDDVHLFSGHIACDSASNSELVVPIYQKDTLFAILDIDSPIYHRFQKEEIEFFQFIADQVSNLLLEDLLFSQKNNGLL